MRWVPVLLLAACALPPQVAFRTEVDRSVRITPGVYHEPIRVVADGVTLDLRGVTLAGITIDGRRNVTIRGGTIRGAKAGIHARDCENLTIEGVEFVDGFRQHLRSTPEREDGADWLWPHNNENNEWLANYGAAIYLERCRRPVVSGCRGRASQNGVVMTRCEDGAVFDNDFSYLSGWGLAMYRTSRTEVAHNRFDYCVRGYSHGIYARGQDSAGILVFEQCCDNVFAYNRATHGGDGFFLYAGHETTQKTGRGGCNGNVVIGNDFSYAVANGIEATFSEDNAFIDNRLDDCDYGVWAGYSRRSKFVGNTIRGALTAGIAIEHGNENLIDHNVFERCPVGVKLWWDDDAEFLASPYGKAQNTRSEKYTIVGNSFRDCREPVELTQTTEVIRDDAAPARTYVLRPPTVRGRDDAFHPDLPRRGRHTMLITEWGPYDYEHLMVQPPRRDVWGEALFEVMSPWPVFTVVGATVPVVVQGTTLRVKPDVPYAIVPFRFAVVSEGERVEVDGTILQAKWLVRHYAWTMDPRTNPDAWKSGDPIKQFATSAPLFHWGSGGPGPTDRFGTVASTEIDLPAGTYEFVTMSDDGVRLTVDDAVAIENWTHHGPTEDRGRATLKAGLHRLRLEHFEIDGWAVLSISFRKVE